jgi:hypothetical protein
VVRAKRSANARAPERREPTTTPPPKAREPGARGPGGAGRSGRRPATEQRRALGRHRPQHLDGAIQGWTITFRAPAERRGPAVDRRRRARAARAGRR